MLEKDIQEVLFTEEQLARRVGEIAQQITQDYQGREIVLISVLRGSFVFMADLCRRIDLPCTVSHTNAFPHLPVKVIREVIRGENSLNPFKEGGLLYQPG